MRFKLDENIPDGLAGDLTAAGHDAATCLQEGIAGAGNPAIAAHAAAERRILMTFDLDFGDIRSYPPGSHPGMVIFRLDSQDIASCRAALTRLLGTIPEPDFDGNLLIVEDNRVRIRRP
jgi:predicted nuclease of predicted toxin-antitoxin system